MAEAEPTLTLSKGALTVDLYSWLHTPGQERFEALAGIEGFGLPDVDLHWFEGAGDGSVYRGSRVKRRIIDLPLAITAPNRSQLNQRLSTLATIINPKTGPARLAFGLPDGDSWFIDVVRSGGGDWSRRSKQSDNRTRIITSLTLEAGDPYWTRVRPEYLRIAQDESGRGLLPYLARLELSRGGAFGIQEVNNIGDADAAPFWRLTGPFSKVTLIGPNGEQLVWEGALSEGGDIDSDNGLYISVAEGRVYDFFGENRYDGLHSSPHFWTIAPGQSQVTIEMTGTSGGIIEPGDPLRYNRVRNSSFELGIDHWGSARATLSHDTTYAWSGDASIRVEVTDDSAYQYLIQNNTEEARTPAAGRTKLTMRAAVRPESTQDFGLGLYEYDESGNLLNSQSGPFSSLAGGRWGTLVSEFQLQEGTHSVRLMVRAATPLPIGYVFHVDAVADVGGNYFTGSTAWREDRAYTWEGTPHDSVSVERLAKRVGKSEAVGEWQPRRWAVV